MSIPNFITRTGLLLVQSTIMEKTGVDVIGLETFKVAPTSFTPAYFMIGDKDKLVDRQKFEKMCSSYAATEKRLKILKGEHSDERSFQEIDEAVFFLRTLISSPRRMQRAPSNRKNVNYKSLTRFKFSKGLQKGYKTSINNQRSSRVKFSQNMRVNLTPPLPSEQNSRIRRRPSEIGIKQKNYKSQMHSPISSIRQKFNQNGYLNIEERRYTSSNQKNSIIKPIPNFSKNAAQNHLTRTKNQFRIFFKNTPPQITLQKLQQKINGTVSSARTVNKNQQPVSLRTQQLHQSRSPQPNVLRNVHEFKRNPVSFKQQLLYTKPKANLNHKIDSKYFPQRSNSNLFGQASNPFQNNSNFSFLVKR